MPKRAEEVCRRSWHTLGAMSPDRQSRSWTEIVNRFFVQSLDFSRYQESATTLYLLWYFVKS